MITTKDSGQREDFVTGARRDTQDDKPQFGLIPLETLDELQQQLGGAPVDVDCGNGPIFDWDKGYTRPDLIPELMLNRLAGLYGRGAMKYGDNNWQMGIPMSRVKESLWRHWVLWLFGDTSEDHLAAVIWNATTLMWTENAVANGVLPGFLADAGPMGQGKSVRSTE